MAFTTVLVELQPGQQGFNAGPVENLELPGPGIHDKMSAYFTILSILGM